MTTFTNVSKSATLSFSNASNNSTSFANTAKSDAGVVFGTLTEADLPGAMSSDYHGKAEDAYTFDEVIVGTSWANQTKS